MFKLIKIAKYICIVVISLLCIAAAPPRVTVRDKAGGITTFPAVGLPYDVPNNAFVQDMQQYTDDRAKWQDGNVKNVESYASFSAALSAIGSSPATVLRIATPQTISTTETVTNNITLEFIDQGNLTESGTATVTINGPIITSLRQIFVNFEPGDIKIGKLVEIISPIWFGADPNATAATATRNAIQAGLDSIAVFTGSTGVGLFGGQIVKLPVGEFWIDDTITIGTHNTQELSYYLSAASKHGTKLVWKGAANKPMIAVGQTVNMLSAQISEMTLINPGSGVTGRTIGINGILINPIAGAGVNRLQINNMRFEGLENAIHGKGTAGTGINNLTIEHNDVHLIYDQSDANPYTDVPETGKGNFIYFEPGTAPQGIYIEDNYVNSIQNYFFDDQSVPGTNNLSIRNNFYEMGSFQKAKGVRGQSAPEFFNIQGNEFQGPVSDNAYGPFFDIGAGALGSSNVSGGIFMANYLDGNGSTPAEPMVRFTYVDGVVYGGNAHFNTGGTGLRLASSTVTNFIILPNNWVSVTTKFSNNGAVGLTNLDTAIGTVSTFQDAVAAGTTPSTAGTFRVPYTGDLRSRNQANGGNVSVISLATVGGINDTIQIGDTGEARVFLPKGKIEWISSFGDFLIRDATANQTRFQIDSLGRWVNALPTGTAPFTVASTSPVNNLTVTRGDNFTLIDSGTKPTCDSTQRFKFWVDAGAGGVKDTVEVCAKDAAEAYAWRVIY